MNNENFLKNRQKGIGGSDAASIAQLYLGEKYPIGAFKTPYEIYLSKTVPIEEQTPIENKILTWGKLMEASIAKRFEKEKSVEVFLQTDYEEPFVHSEQKFAIANPDAIIFDYNKNKWLLEIKTARWIKKHLWGKEGTCQIPLPYLLQCAHYAFVCDAPYVDIAVLIGGGENHEFRTYRYNRNEKIEKKLLQMEEDFWEKYVLKRNPPPPMSLDDVKNKYPRSRPKKKEADAISLDMLKEHKQLHEQIKELSAKKEMLETKIKDYMEDSELLSNGDEIVAKWKSRDSKRVDSKKLKADYPDIYNQVLAESTARTFTNEVKHE